MNFTSAPTRLSPFWHVTVVCLVLLPVTALTAASIFKVDIVAQGSGRFVPVSAVRPVNSLLTGEVTEVLSAPGDLVKQNDIILKLDGSAYRNAEKKAVERHRNAVIEVRRLQAALQVSAAMPPTHPDFVTAGVANFTRAEEDEIETYNRFRARLSAELTAAAASAAELAAKQEALKSEIVGIEAEIAKGQVLVETEEANLTAARKLILTKAITQSEFLRRRQLRETAVSDLARAEQTMAAKQSEAIALAQQSKSSVSALINSWYSSLEAADIAAKEAAIEIEDARKRLSQLDVRAPANGRIEEFNIRTVGARLAEGDLVAKIIPESETVEVEAMLPSSEASFLKEGQSVVIKLDAYPAERFGSIPGKIRSISADSLADAQGRWNFVLRITALRKDLKNRDGNIPVAPGMTVKVNVITGERTLIGYLFEPIVRAISNGWNER